MSVWFWIRINRLKVICDNLCRPLSFGAAVVVIHIGSPDLPGQGRRRGVGMEGQVQVIVSGIALSNGLGQFLAGFIASKLDSAGVQIRLHGVGNPKSFL